MRYSLRTLLILLVFGPPLLAGALQVGKDSWPLFLAMGFTVYFVFALVISWVLARAIDSVINLVKQK